MFGLFYFGEAYFGQGYETGGVYLDADTVTINITPSALEGKEYVDTVGVYLAITPTAVEVKESFNVVIKITVSAVEAFVSPVVELVGKLLRRWSEMFTHGVTDRWAAWLK